MYGGWDTGSMR